MLWMFPRFDSYALDNILLIDADRRQFHNTGFAVKYAESASKVGEIIRACLYCSSAISATFVN